jgi:hypothetical protein
MNKKNQLVLAVKSVREVSNRIMRYPLGGHPAEIRDALTDINYIIDQGVASATLRTRTKLAIVDHGLAGLTLALQYFSRGLDTTGHVVLVITGSLLDSEEKMQDCDDDMVRCMTSMGIVDRASSAVRAQLAAERSGQSESTLTGMIRSRMLEHAGTKSAKPIMPKSKSKTKTQKAYTSRTKKVADFAATAQANHA